MMNATKCSCCTFSFSEECVVSAFRGNILRLTFALYGTSEGSNLTASLLKCDLCFSVYFVSLH